MTCDNRHYSTGAYSPWGEWNSHSLTPVVKWLILANIVVFLLQIFVVGANSPPMSGQALTEQELQRMVLEGQRASIVQEWLQLDTAKVIEEGQLWRLVTAAFCHHRLSILHILVNMLFLFWFGSTLETMLGGREFLLFYLTAAVTASLAFIGLDLYTGARVPAVGASGAVLAVVMLYAWHFPYEEICVCWFFPLQMRWLLLLYVIWNLHPVLLALSGDRLHSSIAHAAHLGGLAFGFLYGKLDWRLEASLRGIRWPRLLTRRPRLRILHAPELFIDPEAKRVDEVLRKIFAAGQASITDEERALLQGASERLRRGR